MNRVDWTKWSAIAEISSAVAILVTLGYLAVQTQQNTSAILAGNRQAFLQAELDYIYQYSGRNPLELDRIFDTQRLENPGGRYDPEAFSNAETMAVAFFRMRETLWLNYMAGAADTTMWEAYRDLLVQAVSGGGMWRSFWDLHSPGFVPGFREEINSRLPL